MACESKETETPFWYKPKSEWLNKSQFVESISMFDETDPSFALIPQVEDAELEDLMYKSYAPKEEISREDHESARRKLQAKLKELKKNRKRFNKQTEDDSK